jgi:hypothetical protein
MFELFLVMIALTSPFLMISAFRHYLKYKAAVNQNILARQQHDETNIIISNQKTLEQLIDRVVILEKIVTS